MKKQICGEGGRRRRRHALCERARAHRQDHGQPAAAIATRRALPNACPDAFALGTRVGEGAGATDQELVLARAEPAVFPILLARRSDRHGGHFVPESSEDFVFEACKGATVQDRSALSQFLVLPLHARRARGWVQGGSRVGPGIPPSKARASCTRGKKGGKKESGTHPGSR